MASHQPTDVNGFVGQREQARGPAGMRPRPGFTSGQPSRLPAQAFQQQGPKFSHNADIAVRRQKARQDVASEIRLNGPLIISNPDQLPFKKRSVTTVIEKAQRAVHTNPVEGIATSAPQAVSFNSVTTKAPRTTFDDTESIVTTEADYVAGHELSSRYPVTLATDYNKHNPASNPNLTIVSSEHANRMRGRIMSKDEGDDHVAEDRPQGQPQMRDGSFGVLEPEWKDLVEAERQRFFTRYQRESTDSIVQDDEHARATQYEHPGGAGGDYYSYNVDSLSNHKYQDGPLEECVVDLHGSAREFSRSAHSAGQSERILHAAVGAQQPHAKSQPGNTGLAESAAKEIPDCDTAKHAKEVIELQIVAVPPNPALATQKIDKGKQAVRNTSFIIPTRSVTPHSDLTRTKATSFGSSSPSPTVEQEVALPNDAGVAAHKHSLEESLDYPREQLVDMSYDELTSKNFLRAPDAHPREHSRVETTLERQLSRMTDMTEDQCSAMFSSMTDADNEGTAQWFLAKLQEDMEHLMVAKHKRRMIALKHEHEIKMRNAMVKAKTKDMEDELDDLKSGLGSLMPGSRK